MEKTSFRPRARSFHSATCLDYNSESPKLLIMGGNLKGTFDKLNDMWILDVRSKMWTEVCTYIHMHIVVFVQMSNWPILKSIILDYCSLLMAQEKLLHYIAPM